MTPPDPTRRHPTAKVPDGWIARYAPSPTWRHVADKLAPHYTPGQYIREARGAGLTWREIRLNLLADTDLKKGLEQATLQYWAQVDRTQVT